MCDAMRFYVLDNYFLCSFFNSFFCFYRNGGRCYVGHCCFYRHLRIQQSSPPRSRIKNRRQHENRNLEEKQHSCLSRINHHHLHHRKKRLTITQQRNQINSTFLEPKRHDGKYRSTRIHREECVRESDHFARFVDEEQLWDEADVEEEC